MNERILIIDDDTYIRDLYKEVLTDAGFVPDVAENGEAGLEKLAAGGCAVVLLDVMMPKLDGLGMLTKLKDMPPKQPNGPIILLTNLDHDPVLDQAKSMGARSHVLKADILPPQLVELVKSAIASPNSAA